MGQNIPRPLSSSGISADESCGDMIYLSDSNPTVTVTSPHYPSDYNGSHPCSWFVKVSFFHISVKSLEDGSMKIDDFTAFTKEGNF